RAPMLSRSCGACCVPAENQRTWLERVAELTWRDANHASKYLSEMARARIADIQRDLNQAARGFPDELLCVRDPFARHELQWRHTGGLLEHMKEMEWAEFHEFSQLFDCDLAR